MNTVAQQSRCRLASRAGERPLFDFFDFLCDSGRYRMAQVMRPIFQRKKRQRIAPLKKVETNTL